MTSHEPLGLARRIIELDAMKDQAVRERDYSRAAELRDQRVAMEWQLRATGNETLYRNVQLKLKDPASLAPLVDILEEEGARHGASIRPDLLRALNSAPLPVRWLTFAEQPPPVAALRQRLSVESLDSAYYRARFPLLASADLMRARHPHDWISALRRESERSPTPVIWLITGSLTDFANACGLEMLLDYLGDPTHEFVACVRDDEDEVDRLLKLPALTEIIT